MPLTHESPRGNLKLLWWLRNFAIGGQSAAVLIVSWGLHIALPLAPLFSIIAVLAALNLLTFLRLKRQTPVTHREFFLQLLADMLGLAGALYLTGGAANPFTSLFILQVVIAAVALPPLYCWLAALAASALYTLLMLFKVELPMLSHAHGEDVFSLHVQGMWVNFLLLALIVAWFVARMSEALRRQDMLLAEAEQLASLGMLATQAAHDLGTPLATMAILAGEYSREARNALQQSRAETFRAQIARCKESISQIAASAGVMRAESGRPVPLALYLAHLVERFGQARPDAHVETEISDSAQAPVITEGLALERAIANLLANAADASPHYVKVQAQCTGQVLTLSITDKGAGMPESIRASLGYPGLTTKDTGLGMGLFLARNVIARLGGTLAAEIPAGGGTVMRIALPLARLSP